MASLLETHGAIITLDGLPIGQSHNPLAFLHKYQGQSADYALKHGGYAIEEREDQIRGHMSYMKIRERRGYGVDGFVVRTCEELQYISLQNGGELTNDRYFTDEIAFHMLKALRASLNYTSGNLQNLNGAIDEFVMTVATRFGIDPDTI